jgi:hypothetical protein
MSFCLHVFGGVTGEQIRVLEISFVYVMTPFYRTTAWN